MRTIITDDPNVDRTHYSFEQSPWKAMWIGHLEHCGAESVVIAYRRRFALAKQATIRVHVSADERYELFLDGQRIGRGPERGDLTNWFYETYDLDLKRGEHVIVARTWWVGPENGSAYAQFSHEPAFLLMAEGQDELLSTGVAQWECKRLGGYTFVSQRIPRTFLVVGPKIEIDGKSFSWGFETGAGDDWQPVRTIAKPGIASAGNEANPFWLLRPAVLPPMLDQAVQVGIARHVDEPKSSDVEQPPVRQANNIASELDQWTKMLEGSACFTIPPRTRRRVVIDLGNYFCAYPQLVTSKGAGSVVRIKWAEALYEDPDRQVKGHRDQIEGKIFRGVYDTFRPDGSQDDRAFQTLWWEAGRYLEIFVETADDPLTIRSLTLFETHYPFEFTSTFSSSEPRLESVVPVALRTLEMCGHETYMDCPYYEQLMYVGDTRLEVLTTYATTVDDRLPRKALLMFDLSRRPSGLTQARYPTRVLQTIPPFSLWYVGMLHDFMMWRGDRAFIEQRIGAVRSVLDVYRRQINDDGLVVSPRGWNYMDWVPQWQHGVPPDGHNGTNGSINFLTVLALRMGAELEEFLNEPEMAARNRRHADRIATSAASAFWDDRRGLFSEDVAHRHASEHVQCLALLAGAVPDDRGQRMIDSLFTDPDLARTTIYFTHYYFEACRLAGRIDKFFDRMSLWFNLREQGFRTTVESPEPSRSDCHAWGAHPVFHYFATLLGIRPARPGFDEIDVAPQLGPLREARGEMTHPRGVVRVVLRQDETGTITGSIELPSGTSGTFRGSSVTRPLQAGANRL